MADDTGANIARYATHEFERWARRDRLLDAEAFLLDHYLDRSRSTVEAGAGGGCILLALQSRGFERLAGFDAVPAMVEAARRRDASGSVDLRVVDAVALPYADGSFEQAVYLGQILSMIEGAADRSRALYEAHRILAPGGRALFSFLCYESRLKRLPCRAYVGYLALLRWALRRDIDLQRQPWLRKGGRLDLDGLLDRGARVYWYRLAEAVSSLRRSGFHIVAAGSDAQLDAGLVFPDPARLTASNVEGFVYFVCDRAPLSPA